MNSAFKDGRVAIVLDRERHLLFSLNALDELQERFGSIEELPSLMKGKDLFKNVRSLMTILLNEGDAENGEAPLTEREVGRLIHAGNIKEAQKSIMQAFIKGTSGGAVPPEDNEEPEEKNLTGGQES